MAPAAPQLRRKVACHTPRQGWPTVTKPNSKKLARIAVANDDVIVRKQLHRCGFGDQRIKTLLRNRWLFPMQRGVYRLGAAPPSWRQRARASHFAGGPLTMLGGASALAWWNVIEPPDGPIELIADRTDGPRPRDTRIRRPTRSITVRTRDGVRVSSIEDALLDYAASHTRAQVEIAVEAALLSRRTTERRLWKVAALNSRQGVRGVRLFRTVLAHRPQGKPAKSVLELEVLDVIRNAGLPLPTRNYDTVDVNGEKREIDFCYVEALGAIEVDSRLWHSTRSQVESDLRRQRALESVGFSFVRVTFRDVHERPEWIVDQVRTLLGGVVAA